MTARRSARISTRTSNAEPAIVHSIQPETLNPSFAADSLINGVGTVSAVQKRRLSATLEPQLPALKQKKGKGKGKTAENRPEQETKDALFAVPVIPSTPNKRRRPALATTSVAPPLSTPTPSAVNLIANNNPNPVTPEKPAGSRRRRKVDPHATNAPLQTPGGNRLTSYPSSIFDSGSQTPSASQQSDSLTTENVLERACAHLVSVDPRLKTIIDKHHCRLFSPEGLAEEVDPFIALASSIIGQQVSGAAAASIKAKFIALFPPPPNVAEGAKYFPTPAQVAAMDIATLRTAGLSQRKAEYIHGLAERFASGELSAKMLIEASDEEVLERLIAVRGLGRWSVEMFACFGLKRLDIFSTGDLGVQRGMASYVGRDVAKLKNKGGKWKYMAEEEMLKIANKFAPFRSLFMWYMWRVEDVNLEVLEK